MSQHVIVTGGAGYIGSHACKVLARDGFIPVVYDNLSIGNRWAVRWGPLELGDIADANRLHDVFHRYKPVAVMHFAAFALVGESVRDPGLYYRNNVMGALNVIEAARLQGARAFVLSSTCAVYGSVASVPIREDTPTVPINPYGMSKLMVEKILADFDSAYEFPYLALRYFNAAGADPAGEIGERRDVETHLVPLVLDAIAGRRSALQILGNDYPTPDGTAIRDYIHVSDLAEAHVRGLRYLLDGGKSRALNLGTGRGYSVREIIEAAAEVTGSPVPHQVAARRPGDPAALVADASAGRALLGEDLVQRSSLHTIVQDAWNWQSSEAYQQAFFVPGR
jgi:UDP-arabinose 4-epimerase